MKSIQLVGIKGDPKYKVWKNHILDILDMADNPIQLEEINKVDKILELHLSAIPALLINDQIIMEQNNHLPDLKEIKSNIDQYFSRREMRTKNILIPTDFSDNASNALKYAKDLSKVLGSQLKLIHILKIRKDKIEEQSIPTVENLIASRRLKLSSFVELFKQKHPTSDHNEDSIKQELQTGSPVQVLVNSSKSEGVDMILMGTRGSNKLVSKLLGSTSSKVAQSAFCPVWLVPPNATFSGIKKILYASNYESADNKILSKTNALAKQFGAEIHHVHIDESKDHVDLRLEELILTNLFREKTQDKDLTVKNIKHSNVCEELNKYAGEHQMDLIVLATKHRDFWAKLWHHSQTKEMVLNAKTPLLVMHIND